MWAFPKKDEHVNAIYNENKSSFEKPKKLEDFINTSFTDSASYAAVFVPGGHGAMLGIPEDRKVGKILNWAHEKELFTITLCHGPDSLLTTTLNNQKFLYEGYKMAAFPDSVDKQTPMIGYLPGHMPWGLSEKLKSLGARD
ncbi:MAG: molecular chaperone Hsp31 and glyoxalase 3 [Polaribacter sp.]|jgi:molecular chaperone Hsp31 and glyoxalase 3